MVTSDGSSSAASLIDDDGTNNNNNNSSSAAARRSSSVFLYVPNLIGYVRVLLMVVAFSVALTNWVLFLFLYGTSELIDCADGWAARRFGQVSHFGAVLDQVTDRLSTTLLYLLNCRSYPNHFLAFAFVCLADVGGHWIHTFGSVVAGAETHKKIPSNRPLLKAYYDVPGLMPLCIVCYESFFLSLFIASEASASSLVYRVARGVMFASLPIAVLKVVTNILQAVYGAEVLVAVDEQRKQQQLRQRAGPSHRQSVSGDRSRGGGLETPKGD